MARRGEPEVREVRRTGSTSPRHQWLPKNVAVHRVERDADADE
jgi:hypothetical protein